MTVITGFLRCISVAAIACVVWADTASGQAATAGCALEAVAGTSRQILRCQDGLTVIAEGGARYNLVDRNGDGSPDAVSLRSKAVLIDVDSSLRQGGFQVVTPQAIAAVRGTRWAVDVQGSKTSVLVVRGRVAVRRPAGDSVFLGPGEGVDVERGTEPLTVRRWPAARAAALLARLGQ